VESTLDEGLMATYLAQITRKPAPERHSRTDIRIRIDVGRTLGVVLVGSLLVVGAVVLWAMDKTTAAPIVFGFGEAVIAGGLGIAFGEKRGAEAARDQMNDEG
jgi:hypothetical protein